MTTVATPSLSGLHHLKVPVFDLEANLNWYQRVFGAHHLRALDHLDSDGARYVPL
jgi:catechol 2,3-dioxygenase-like lactoylglutathione lyase family enzyme